MTNNLIKKIDSFAKRELVRSMWQFAAISQFLHFFGLSIDLKHFDTELLEEALLHENEQELLVDVHAKLLSQYYRSKYVTASNYSEYLRTFCYEHDSYFGGEQPFLIPPDLQVAESTEDFLEYGSLPVRTRVLVLHALCEAQWEFPDRFNKDHITESAAVQWRMNPVGWDAFGNVFWLFDDHRLYQEVLYTPKKKAASVKKQPTSAAEPSNVAEWTDLANFNDYEAISGSNWKVVCSNLSEWRLFPDTFSKSKSSNEKELCQFLKKQAAPIAIEHYEKKEHELAMQLALINRKRSSRLVRLESEKTDREQREKQQRDKLLAAERERKRVEAERKAVNEEKERREARERRLRERETRLENERLQREKALLDRERRVEKRQIGVLISDEKDAPEDIDVVGDSSAATSEKNDQTSAPRKQPAEGEDWELNCECGAKGRNSGDKRPMIMCERCHVWAHLDCSLGQKLANTTVQEREKRLRRKWWCIDCQEKRRVERSERKKLRKMASETSNSSLETLGHSITAQHENALHVSSPSHVTNNLALPFNVAPFRSFGIPTNSASQSIHKPSNPASVAVNGYATGAFRPPVLNPNFYPSVPNMFIPNYPANSTNGIAADYRSHIPGIQLAPPNIAAASGAAILPKFPDIPKPFVEQAPVESEPSSNVHGTDNNI